MPIISIFLRQVANSTSFSLGFSLSAIVQCF
jgi:hypothetical protein